jgi:hypothetical protein
MLGVVTSVPCVVAVVLSAAAACRWREPSFVALEVPFSIVRRHRG